MLFAELWGTGDLTFESPVFHLTLIFKLIPFRITPLDFQVAKNLDRRFDYCMGLTWTR